MFRRTPKDFLKDNLFSIITVLLAVVISFGLYCATSLLSAKLAFKLAFKSEKPAVKTSEEMFVITCFNNNVGMRCKSPKAGGHCSADFRKNLQAICADMEGLDISPFDKIAVDIRKYDACDKKLEEQAGCLPHFIREGEINGYGAGFIYLPASLFSDKESLRAVLIHEITHALTSKYQMTTARIVKEFFAIYAQIQFYGYNLIRTCNGTEWNQPALRNYGGEYVFPPRKEHRSMNALSTCRYGQLEYIVRKLHGKSPFLFGALWRELEKNKDGKIDTARLKRQIAAIDSEAGKIASQAHILNEADATPQLAIVGDTYEHCAFIYKNAGVSEEHYGAKAGFQLEWRRGNKRIAWIALSHAPLFCYPADGFLSGDVLHIRAAGFGQSFYRLFIVP